MRARSVLVFGFLAALIVGLETSSAGTDSDDFNVSLTITSSCDVSAPNNLGFPAQGVLASDVTATVNFSIQCTNGTVGTLSLNDGDSTNGTVVLRQLEAGTEDIGYTLYTDNTYTTIWGDDTSGTSKVSHTGTGSSTDLTIFGKVPAQTTPSAQTYTDTVTVTVDYN